MTHHNYTEVFTTEKFDVQISPSTEYGYFEHHELGDGCGGSLWFTGSKLVDYDGVYDLPKQVRKVLKNAGYDGDILYDEEPHVQLAELQSPLPETNIEFVTRIMTFSKHGALAQMFVTEALEWYAQQVIATPDDKWPENSFINKAAWDATAQEILDELKAKYDK